MTQLRAIDTAYAEGKEHLLEILDTLRADIESGKITAFGAVGIAADDQTFAYTAAARHFSRLRMAGACAHLLHCVQHGETDA